MFYSCVILVNIAEACECLRNSVSAQELFGAKGLGLVMVHWVEDSQEDNEGYNATRDSYCVAPVSYKKISEDQ